MMVHQYHLRTTDIYPSAVLNWSAVTPFHTQQWADLVKHSFGIETQHATVMDGDTLVAYLPYSYGGLFGTKLRSRPAVANYSPSVIFDEKVARESTIIRQSLAQRYPDATLNAFSDATSSTSIFNLHINGGFEKYWQDKVHAKAKYDVRKADKHAIKTQFLGAEACGVFYSLYLKRMQELGSPALSVDFFRALSRYFEGDFSFAVSFKDQRPVAASTLLGLNNRWIGHPWSVSDSAFRGESVNYAHYRDLIKHAFDGGYKQFYLGPSLKNSNWSRIKLRFGGDESFPVRLDGKFNSHASESPVVQTVQSVITHLPKKIFRHASPAISKIAIKLLG